MTVHLHLAAEALANSTLCGLDTRSPRSLPYAGVTTLLDRHVERFAAQGIDLCPVCSAHRPAPDPPVASVEEILDDLFPPDTDRSTIDT